MITRLLIGLAILLSSVVLLVQAAPADAASKSSLPANVPAVTAEVHRDVQAVAPH